MKIRVEQLLALVMIALSLAQYASPGEGVAGYASRTLPADIMPYLALWLLLGGMVLLAGTDDLLAMLVLVIPLGIYSTLAWAWAFSTPSVALMTPLVYTATLIIPLLDRCRELLAEQTFIERFICTYGNMRNVMGLVQIIGGLDAIFRPDTAIWSLIEASSAIPTPIVGALIAGCGLILLLTDIWDRHVLLLNFGTLFYGCFLVVYLTGTQLTFAPVPMYAGFILIVFFVVGQQGSDPVYDLFDATHIRTTERD